MTTEADQKVDSFQMSLHALKLLEACGGDVELAKAKVEGMARSIEETEAEHKEDLARRRKKDRATRAARAKGKGK
jgi:hypothetical protein